jgi:Ser/Thr protein kinase RdoA (MazF antagonist)
MTASTISPIRTRDDITETWLGSVLDRPGLGIDGVEAIGTGQMSQCYRVRLGDGDTVVVKLASEDPTSRATGVGMGAYAREISFYSELAGRIEGALPRCFYAAIDGDGWFTLVLEDIVGGRPGDQIAGCDVDDARLAVRALARVHAPVFGDLHLGTAPWLNQPSPLNQGLLEMLLPGFLERYEDRITPEHVEVCKQFVAALDGWANDRRAPLGLVHGDYRLDNLLFAEESCHVVDWQTVSWGPAMLDVSYFIGGGLSVDDRRAHEVDLVRAYYDELSASGVTGVTWEFCWDEYRRQTFHGLLMSIAASMVVVRTDRGDDMFMTQLARSAQQVLDLDALSLLPASGGKAPALVPSPTDEGSHTPGPEATWNESWYFDAVAPDGSLGVYVRVGRVPNQDLALYTAAIVAPGQPAILVVDAHAPLPAADDPTQTIATDTIKAAQHCRDPLTRFSVTLAATGARHDDHSAPLRSEAGTPVPVALDLTWETTGAPYQWRVATRYEIPCRVTGTVRIGDDELVLDGPGQRGHSLGPRDWWANDWMWTALHLDDGTHVHAVTIPELEGFGVGYVQRDGEIDEVSGAASAETVADNGLIETATVTITQPEPALALAIAPLAFGALRLEAPDGRVSHFPRAMCRVTAGDGREGLGWIEWNRNQRD